MIAGALVLAALRRRRPAHARRPARRRSLDFSRSSLIPTFLGQLLLFRVLRLFGSRKLSIVTFLMPGFAVVYGALLLDEPITRRCSPGSR